MPVARCLSQFIISGAALALTMVLGAESPGPPLPAPPVDIRLSIKTFRVHGRSTRAIRHSLRTEGPLDQRGTSRDAFTSWHIRWRWPEVAGANVNPALIQVSVTGEILIPVLSPSIEKENPTWRTYRRSLVMHELNHFRHALLGSERLAQEYRDLAPEGEIAVAHAHQIARRVLARVRAEDRKYDLITNHGKSEGIRW